MSLTIIDHSGGILLTSANGEVHIISSWSIPSTIVLPVAKAGYSAIFCKSIDLGLSIRANGVDTIVGSLTGGRLENVTGGEVGKVCRIKCVVAGEWVLDGDFTGTWVVNNT